MADDVIEYQNRIVVYIDILGFKTFIDKTVNADGKDVPDAIKDIVDAYSEIRDALMLNPNLESSFEMKIHENNVKSNRMVTIFSDTVVISFQLNSIDAIYYVLFDVNWMLSRLVEKGILCRGGIAYGKLIHDNNKIFGPALVDAYVRESKAALYPRVILGPEILELVGTTTENQWGDIRHLVRKDSDGMFYVDYFTAIEHEFAEPDPDYPLYMQSLQRLVKTGISSSKPDIRVKYMWLRERYNEALERMNVPKVIQDIEGDIENAGEELLQIYKGLEPA